MFDRAERGNRAVILHPVFKQTGQGELDEFTELARSAGVEVVAVVTAPRNRKDAKFYVGSGKIDELAEQVKTSEADLILAFPLIDE